MSSSGQPDAENPFLLQPWEFQGVTKEKFMELARAQEKSGRRLVTEMLLNGYPDPMGEGDLWIVDWLEYTDYRTGQRVGGYAPMDDEPGEELANLLVVQRRLNND